MPVFTALAFCFMVGDCQELQLFLLCCSVL
nr:MAG TPA: hypothetical protein [Caudoviricetes sp.]